MVDVAVTAFVEFPATIEKIEVAFTTIWLLTEEITGDAALILSAGKQFCD